MVKFRSPNNNTTDMHCVSKRIPT